MPSKTKLTSAQRAERRQRPSLAFRRFRAQHSKLSTVYWTHELGVELLRKSLHGIPPDAQVVTTLGLPIAIESFAHNAHDSLAWVDDYLNRSRLQILAFCSANLEAFLKDAALAWVATMGHLKSLGELSPVGEAIASPIAKRSSINEMLDYAEHLFGVTYGVHKRQWERAYRLRCVLVHTRGNLTASNAVRLGVSNPIIGELPRYEWATLKADLAAAYHIADITDKVLKNDKMRLGEMAIELKALEKAKKLPSKDAVWTYLHSLGFNSPTASDRAALRKAFYT